MSVFDEIKTMQNQSQQEAEQLSTPNNTIEESRKPNSIETGSVGSAGVSPTKDIASVTESDNVIQKTLGQAMTKRVEKEGADNLKGLAKDLTYIKGASDLQSDQEFTKTYQAELGKQLVKDLKDEGVRAAIVEGSKKREAINIRNQAFYEGCKPIFTLLGIEAAFGYVAMIITVGLLMIPFLAICIIRFAINSVNSIFTAISEFKKPAFWLCTIIVVLAIAALVLLVILASIDKLFGTTIIGVAMSQY